MRETILFQTRVPFFQENVFPVINTIFPVATSSVELTGQEKYKVFSLELKLAPGGIFGTSNVSSSSSASVASKVNVNVSPKVTVIEVTFCRKTGALFSEKISRYFINLFMNSFLLYLIFVKKIIIIRQIFCCDNNKKSYRSSRAVLTI